MDNAAKTIQDQLKSLYPDIQPVAAPTTKEKTLKVPKKNPVNPRNVVTVEMEGDHVLVKKATEKAYVVNEAQLYHMIATILTKEGTESLWFPRTPSRSARGDLWVLHNPKALQVLVDPLATCRSAMSEFNQKGRFLLQCFPSRKEYYATRSETANDPSSTPRIQPVVILDGPTESAEDLAPVTTAEVLEKTPSSNV